MSGSEEHLCSAAGHFTRKADNASRRAAEAAAADRRASENKERERRLFEAANKLAAGYDLKRMKEEGFRAAELRALGADLPALVTAGYSVTEGAERVGFPSFTTIGGRSRLQEDEGGRIMRCTAQCFSRRPACS
jgi:hypothetical protein